MVARETIVEDVHALVGEQIGLTEGQQEALKLTDSFQDDIGMDSLDVIELVMSFEEKYDVSISDEDAEKIHTVGDAVDYLEQILREK